MTELQTETTVCRSATSPSLREHENQADTSDQYLPEPPPDGGYGWVCVACCFTLNCFTWGVVAVSDQANNIGFGVERKGIR